MPRSFAYPWTQWFERKKFRISRGKDFHCMVHSMAQQIRTKAAQRGVSVSIAIIEDTIQVTVSKEDAHAAKT